MSEENEPLGAPPNDDHETQACLDKEMVRKRLQDWIAAAHCGRKGKKAPLSPEQQELSRRLQRRIREWHEAGFVSRDRASRIKDKS